MLKCHVVLQIDSVYPILAVFFCLFEYFEKIENDFYSNFSRKKLIYIYYMVQNNSSRVSRHCGSECIHRQMPFLLWIGKKRHIDVPSQFDINSNQFDVEILSWHFFSRDASQSYQVWNIFFLNSLFEIEVSNWNWCKCNPC